MNLHFKKLDRLPTDYKYILKWTDAYAHYMTPLKRNHQNVFVDSNCSFVNCYLTTDRRLLSDVRHFDAILFDVENNWDFHPLIRSPYQKFIFVAIESAASYPLCYKGWDNYFNLTWTYRLDSDIRWSYITVLDKNGTVVGPKVDMNWVDPMDPAPESVMKVIKGKNKTAAWFVSHCKSKGKREDYVDKLQAALRKYGLEVDIFGWCGKLQCTKDRLSDCLKIVEQEYFFYLAFENSLAEDYVTEKLLYAVHHHTVPIVYGGANYSRFLPPGSYINAREHEPRIVASMMHKAINNPQVYEDYFRWHNYYTYKRSPEDTDVCNLCERLNEPLTFRAVKNLRKWWLEDYEKVCKVEVLKNNTEKRKSLRVNPASVCHTR
ncbi:alpha-(1,3)-fucosyltransferase C-like [Ostrinia nubilalis]|uniref:alpha-(1,3)-fucosyltransferase C-like n=1 Tax=Ostrinia nubilalis TaxID=29057 RepID=UPI0030825208